MPLVAGGGALLTRSVAQGDVGITITENSSSSLGLNVTGATGVTTVKNNSPDHWTVTVPFAIQFNFQQFERTESATASNLVTFTGGDCSTFTTFTVVSDGPIVDEEDGTFQDAEPAIVGTLSDGNTRVFVNVIDRADSKEGHGVPDTGSTVGLLDLALAALVAASRLRSIQLA